MQFNRPRPLTVAQQYLNLRANPACAGKGRLHGNMMSWHLPVTPTPFSRCYTARLEYRQDASPQVFIDGPDLTVLADGRRLPHVYEQAPTRLCLFLPGSGEWGAWMRLDQTIVPWTALWLLYFEEWLYSGEWAGGGLHPIVLERARGRRRCRIGPRLRSTGASS
jgi:hypothetical protein